MSPHRLLRLKKSTSTIESMKLMKGEGEGNVLKGNNNNEIEGTSNEKESGIGSSEGYDMSK